MKNFINLNELQSIQIPKKIYSLKNMCLSKPNELEVCIGNNAIMKIFFS